MAKLPVHLRWELSPVPHEKGKGRYGGSYLEEYEWWTKPREKSLVSELTYMFLEIVFLKGVWEHNRRLWWFSFPLHFGLYLLIGTAGLFVVGAILELAGVPSSDWALFRTAVLVLAAPGYLLGAVGAAGLLVSRLSDSRFQATTTPASLFNLGLLLAMFASGGLALSVSDDFAAKTTTVVTALLTANSSVETSAVLAIHLVLVLVFLAYLPFSQMMHFVAKYFTYHEVRWDDEPSTPGGRLEKEVTELLKQPVTWSAPHLNADGEKNWVDLATEETEK
jgi:nitrate reductase gamma subunit